MIKGNRYTIQNEKIINWCITPDVAKYIAFNAKGIIKIAGNTIINEPKNLLCFIMYTTTDAAKNKAIT